jgi:hypothetical protein
LLVAADAEFGFTSFSGCFGEPSSAFLLIPFVAVGVAGKVGRELGLLTTRGGRNALALKGLAGGFGGAGDLSLPIELTMSLKRLIFNGLWVGNGGRKS